MKGREQLILELGYRNVGQSDLRAGQLKLLVLFPINRLLAGIAFGQVFDEHSSLRQRHANGHLFADPGFLFEISSVPRKSGQFDVSH